MSGDKRRETLDLALRLFQGRITITGTTRSGESGTMIVEDGGAFAALGNLEDLVAASLEAERRATDA